MVSPYKRTERRGASVPAYAILFAILAGGVTVAAENIGFEVERLFEHTADNMNAVQGSVAALSTSSVTSSNQTSDGNNGDIVVGGLMLTNGEPEGAQLLAASDGAGAGTFLFKTKTNGEFQNVYSVQAGPQAVYVSSDGNIYKRKRDKTEWKLKAHNDNVTDIVVKNGKLYTSSDDETVKKWDISNGKPSSPEWTFSLSEAFFNGAPASVESLAVSKNAVYAGDFDGYVHKIDAGGDPNIPDGDPVWKFKAVSNQVHSLSINNDTIYTGGGWEDKDVEAWNISENGAPTPGTKDDPEWRFTGSDNKIESLAVDGGVIYAGSFEDLHKIDAQNGTEMWGGTAFTGAHGGYIKDIAVDADGDIYTAGRGSGNAPTAHACGIKPDKTKKWCKSTNLDSNTGVAVAPFKK